MSDNNNNNNSSNQQQQQHHAAAAATATTTTTPHRHGHTHNPYSTTGGVATTTATTSPARLAAAFGTSPTATTTSSTAAVNDGAAATTTTYSNNNAAAAAAAAASSATATSASTTATATSAPDLLKIPAEYHETTLHRPLIGFVSFVPYPKTQVTFAQDSFDSDHADMYQRIFIGQLPYGVTEMQLQWMAQIFGGGVTLYDPEVIIKGGKKTGCVHAKVRDSQLKQLVAGMHKRLLVDDSGVWVGRTPQEIQILTQYVSELKADNKKRYPDRPYDTVVVQNATSERQQHHQGLPTIEEYFAMQHGIYPTAAAAVAGAGDMTGAGAY